MDRITPYTRPLTDPEREYEIRQAIAAAALSRASREEGRTIASDSKIDAVLSRVSPRALEAITIEASTEAELRKAIREVVASGDLFPPRGEYTDEELEL